MFSFVFNLFEIILGQISFIFDFRSKGLKDRITNVVDGLKKIEDPSLTQAIQVLETFRDNGFNFNLVFSQMPEEIESIVKLVELLSDPKYPIIRAVSDALPITDFGIYANFTLNILSVLSNGNGKIYDIKRNIDNLPDKGEGKEETIKDRLQTIYNFTLTILPKMILENPIVEWLGEMADHSLSEKIVSLILNIFYSANKMEKQSPMSLIFNMKP